MLIRWLIYIVVAYVVVNLYAILFANFYLFQAPKPTYQDSNNIIKIKTNDGALISAVYLANKNAVFTLLVSHGNAEDLGIVMPFLQLLHDHGFAVFAYDYHGYGTSTGSPTELNTYLDIDAVYNYLTEQLHIPPDHIILYGHSLGAAMAIDLAARKPVAGLIIESPFVTAYRTITQIPLFFFDKYNNLEKIKKVTCPVLVIHGLKDQVIPFWQGKRLYNEVTSPKSFLWLKEADHNDVAIIGGNVYWQAIEDFVHRYIQKK